MVDWTPIRQRRSVVRELFPPPYLPPLWPLPGTHPLHPKTQVSTHQPANNPKTFSSLKPLGNSTTRAIHREFWPEPISTFTHPPIMPL